MLSVKLAWNHDPGGATMNFSCVIVARTTKGASELTGDIFTAQHTSQI